MTVEALRDTPAAADGEPAGVCRLSDHGLVEEFLQARRRVACLEARSAALLSEIDRRGIHQEEGFGSATGWLVARTGDRRRCVAAGWG